ncbi:MAG: DUF2142 domain-containing protein [Anaerolineae bacterium]|jgi:uncharacterized membrane protein|nr:DUF2142 domain-containing protein [Anaerolineae bacterium]MBT7074889.1 DUF2142 domain-containing protein [Anaerolineae bacterium]MBT7781828.1 DUF2142 domain-containing protein [Anaerolineae bacterium]
MKLKLSPVEIFLLIASSFFGILALIYLPISAGYDEETHLVRAWQMSTLDMLPNKVDEAEIPFPQIYWDLSYRRQFLVRSVPQDFWDKYGDLSIDSREYVYGVSTRSVYSPLLLVPQAIVLRYAGRSLDLPALPVFYLTRLAGLLSYILLIWLSLRLIPYGKWLFALLALSPIALLQAVTISADTISNGIAFLFIAGVLAIAQKEKIQKKDWWGLVFLVFLLFSAKVNLLYLILLPLLLIPPKRFKTKRSYYFFITSIFLLFLVEVLGWTIIAYPRLGTAPDGTNPLGQIQFILTNLPFFIKTLVIDIINSAGIRFNNWIAIYGYDYWPTPKIVYWLYGGALLLALFIDDKKEKKISPKERKVFLILFVIGYIATILLMYLSFTPVGSSVVIGVQGRYFTVVMPLLFLAILRIRKFTLSKGALAKKTALLLGVSSLVVYTLGLWLSYQTPCGSQYYQEGFCYQPNYKNFSPETVYSAPISNELSLTQEISPECDGMEEIRVWVNTEKSSPLGQTEFSLSTQAGREIAKEIVLNTNLAASGWYFLSFAPEWSSSQESYNFSINTMDQSDILIAYSIRPEYPAGKLYENDSPSKQDIIFQYGCIAGWEKNLTEQKR